MTSRYTHQTRVPRYIRKTLTELKRETGSSTIIAEVLNTLLLIMDRIPRQNLKKRK